MVSKQEQERRDKIHEEAKLASIRRKSHTKDLFGMESVVQFKGHMVPHERIKTQAPFKQAVQSIKDFHAGLFKLDFVDRIECQENPNEMEDYQAWDKCTVHFRGREQEFFDINTILTEENKVKEIMSEEKKFKIVFKEPTAIQLYTWHGSLIDLNPKDIKKVILDRKVSAKERKKVAFRMKFTKLGKKGEVSFY